MRMNIIGAIAASLLLNQLTHAQLTVWTCPSECRCDPNVNGLSVRCRSVSVPSGIPNKTSQLTINGLDIEALPDNIFLNLTLLSSLTIIGGKVKQILRNSFSGLKLLKTLVLEYLDIVVIDGEAFAPLDSIKLLSLRGNQKLKFSGAQLAFLGLQNSSIETLHLDRISVNDFTLKPSIFKYFENVRMKTITMSDNMIGIIEPGFGKYIRHAEKLNLSHNYILGKDEAMIELLLFKELSSLDLSYQRSQGEEKHFEISKDGNHVNVSKQIAPYSQTKVETSRKEHIDIACADEFIFPFPPKLEYLYVHHLARGPQNFRDKTCFNPENSLKMVEASDNMLLSMDRPFIGFNRIEYISIDNCHCHHMAPNVFEYAPALKTLKIGNNKLASLIQGDINGSLFRKNTELQILDVNNNGIVNLPKGFLNSVRRVKVLDVSRNRISSIGGLNDFHNLTCINLSSNSISFIPENELLTFDKIALRTNLSVSLANNPLTLSSRCCDVQIFILWTLKTKVHLPDLQKYTCVSPNGDFLHFNEHTPDSISRLCKIFPQFVVIYAIVPLITILLVTFGSLMYRYRWKVRWLIIASRRLLRLQEETRDTTAYDYDAFVSFNVDDIKWVKYNLIVELEQKRGLKLCIHHRDFRPGLPIEDNIVDAIERSRKVILMLSSNFVKSNWCHFEVQMARNKLIEKGYDIIVPVILEGFDLNLTSRTLRNVLDKNTYLTWDGNDIEAQDHFWWQLSEVIKGTHTNDLLSE